MDSPARRDQPNLGRLLLDRFRWFDEALRAALSSRLGLEMTSAQSLLFADLPHTGTSQAELARRLGVSRQAVNELVSGLVDQGLVELVPHPESRRVKLVRPTPLGEESIRTALKTFAALEGELRSRIGDKNVDHLRTALSTDWGAPPS